MQDYIHSSLPAGCKITMVVGYFFLHNVLNGIRQKLKKAG